MAKKKSEGASVNLDSFLDIMTCLVGVLVLIIILTGIDASQIKVLINTPMEYESDKRPVFIECRNNQLFLIPLEEINKVADDKLREIAGKKHISTKEIYRLASETKSAKTDHYWVDLTYSLIGQTVLNPIDGQPGYDLAKQYKEKGEETSSDWFGSIIAKFNKEDQMLSFIVRDDSFKVFKIARALAWMERIDVSYELLPSGEQIKFGIFGDQPKPM